MEKNLKARDSTEDILWCTVVTSLDRLELPKWSILAGFYRYKKKLPNYTVFLFIKQFESRFQCFYQNKNKKRAVLKSHLYVFWECESEGRESCTSGKSKIEVVCGGLETGNIIGVVVLQIIIIIDMKIYLWPFACSIQKFLIWITIILYLS